MKHLALAAALCLGLTACQTVYYSAMEKVGVHKREILVDRVEATKESQQTSQQEFQTALERLTTLVNFCLLYTSPSPRDRQKSRMPSSA